MKDARAYGPGGSYPSLTNQEAGVQLEFPGSLEWWEYPEPDQEELLEMQRRDIAALGGELRRLQNERCSKAASPIDPRAVGGI